MWNPRGKTLEPTGKTTEPTGKSRNPRQKWGLRGGAGARARGGRGGRRKGGEVRGGGGEIARMHNTGRGTCELTRKA